MFLNWGNGMATNQKRKWQSLWKLRLQSSWNQQICSKKNKENSSPHSFTVVYDYLSQVACHFDVVPGVVIEFSVDWLNDGLKSPGAQIDDEGNCPIFQRQVDIVSRFPSVEKQAVALPGLEWQCDFVTAALNGVLGQVVAEVLGATESGHIFFSHWNDKGKQPLGYSAVNMLIKKRSQLRKQSRFKQKWAGAHTHIKLLTIIRGAEISLFTWDHKILPVWLDLGFTYRLRQTRVLMMEHYSLLMAHINQTLSDLRVLYHCCCKVASWVLVLSIGR